jgi:hypothetical protein
MESGKEMRDSDAQVRSEAARAMGRARTPAKQAAAVKRAEKRKGIPLSEERKEQIRQAQLLRWERYRAEKAAQAASSPPVPKRPVGRPKKAVPQTENLFSK